MSDERKRVLVLGGAGMLGHKVVEVFAARFPTYATVRCASRVQGRRDFAQATILDGIDVAVEGALEAVMAQVRPAVVVNCIAAIKQTPAGRDPVACITINALLPHWLASLAVKHHARLIHISTDGVFSGDRGGYRETDLPDTTDLYGRSKLLGEVAQEGCLTLRTAVIGRELASANGLVEWLCSNRGGRVKGYTKALFNGVTTIVLARELARLIEEFPGLSGVYHFSGEVIDKAALLTLVRDALEVEVEIDSCPGTVVDRSLDSSLLRASTRFAVPPWPQMIAEMAADARTGGYGRPPSS